ncbi:hypothetical protein EXIGLDRAFT_427306 [Exidia glandulosa HHB12029]|uniref:Uncharacterized protein n=1 Tax=Exidia glandulosa HHB12029 TaxID=1314781 RepID=A0A165BBX1_EXIGL|nr:hypothetical protein EXIGLDRAFT_427306 [Exidia glandulosa HHB12029]
MDAKSTTSSEDTVVVTALDNKAKDASHLAMFQALSACLRQDPNQVIDRLTRWFVSDDHSPLWTPFALSIRGWAFEELDDEESAGDDYSEALHLYRYMAEQLGSEVLVRFKDNMRFIEARLKALPPGERRRTRDSALTQAQATTIHTEVGAVMYSHRVELRVPSQNMSW